MRIDRRFIVLAALALAALILSIFAFVKAGDNESAPKSNTVQIGETQKVDSLTGNWKADKMTAVVTDTSISISWDADGTTGLYWKGTFVVAAKDGEKIQSTGDVAAMEESFLSSRDTEKEFVYQDGKLSFKRTVMGVTSVISLVRAS